MKKLKQQKENWLWEWERNAYPFYLYCFTYQWRYPRHSPIVYSAITFSGGQCNAYLDHSSVEKAAQTILSKVMRGKSFFNQWQRYVHTTGRELHNLCDRLDRLDYSQQTDRKLKDLIREVFIRYERHNGNVGVIRNANRLLQQRLTERFGAERVSRLLATNKRSLFTDGKISLLHIKERMKKFSLTDARLRKALEKHTLRYFFLPLGYYREQPFTVKDFTRKFQEVRGSTETLKDFKKHLEIDVQKRADFLRNLKPTIEEHRLISFGSANTYFKDFIRANLNRLQYYIRRLFIEVARRTGNRWEAVACLFPEEIIKLISSRRKITVPSRMVIYSDSEGIHRVAGAAALVRRLQSTRIITLDTVRGTIAKTGRAVGNVLKLKKLSDVQGKQLRHIVIVAPMTTPDLMPVLKHAVAIVTDEGGLTCHAAIIARELGIPCVIGTKIATKVFKTGDRVEVDATRGVVRKV